VHQVGDQQRLWMCHVILFTHDTDRYTNTVSYRFYMLRTVTRANKNHPVYSSVHIIQGQDP